MGHTFDTGLPRAQRSTVRAAVIAKLAPLLKANGGYVRAIGELPRVYRGAGDEDGLAFIAQALQGQAPAIAVALGRRTTESAGPEPITARSELAIAIYAISANQRAFVAGRMAIDAAGLASDAADPGIETLLEHIEQLLLGQEIAVDGVSEMRSAGEDEVLTAGDGTIWEQSYTVMVERQINPLRLVTQLLLSIEGKHNLDTTVGTAIDPLVDTVAQLAPPEV